MSSRTYLSIGDVLTLLREEFPDVTISKIRFLESQGLVNPERSPSGYRKFFDHDVERLRWVLRQQREHFLPLKVIRDRLADGELGRCRRPSGRTARRPSRSHAGRRGRRRSGHAHEQPTKADEEAMARILADASRRRRSLPETAQRTARAAGGRGGRRASPPVARAASRHALSRRRQRTRSHRRAERRDAATRAERVDRARRNVGGARGALRHSGGTGDRVPAPAPATRRRADRQPRRRREAAGRDGTEDTARARRAERRRASRRTTNAPGPAAHGHRRQPDRRGALRGLRAVSRGGGGPRGLRADRARHRSPAWRPTTRTP